MAQIRYMEAINQALMLEMERDSSVFVAGEDVAGGGVFAVTRGILEKFGEKRIRNTPISESAIVGLGIGAALTGLRPVVEIMFMDFIGCCMDQIINQAAKIRYMFGGKMSVPMVIRTPEGAGLGAGPQHSQCLEILLAHIPGLKVVMPSTPYDAKGLMISSIRDNNPVIYIEHKLLYRVKGEVPEEAYSIPIGKADIKRAGEDVTIVAVSYMVKVALEAAAGLEKEGINAEVVDPRTISPLDKDTILESVKKTGRLVIVHEAVKDYGFGAEVAAIVAQEAFDFLDAPIVRIGAPFMPVPFSKLSEASYVPGKDRIVSEVRKMVNL
ncbi:MAG: alpha-ketoacid dehydrogenase subunit beta [Deltaproteobacteria bacterium]|nr:alpha-ketoacid dehydrogenase subunit beta [Deltaproteobacteria bacterium]MBW2025339.1 alpha-ketoacid dehydrogenase subunit beta [Deltaproteobacteria bacterium]MBW2125206.1 alpha-ketoacid dehydrogenase subunit beta [Deltaproteobacteria bacterium]